MPVSVAAAVATVTTSAIDGTETVPVLMSAVIAAAELSAAANGEVIDADFVTAAISGITLASPGVFTTVVAHGLVVDDKVYIEGVVGTTQVNARSYTVNSVPTTTTFTLKTERGTAFVFDAVNTSAYTAWVSGGMVRRLLFSGQLIGVRVDIGTSAWLKIDDGFSYIARTSTRLNPSAETSASANNGGVTVLGYRSTSVIATTTTYFDANALATATGGRFFSLRSPDGTNPKVIHTYQTRNDWPTIESSTAPAEYRIEGLSVRSTADSRKWYGGQSRNVGARDALSNLTLSGSGEIFQANATVYTSAVIPSLFVGGDYAAANKELLRCTLGTELGATASIDGTHRQNRAWFTDCLFSGWWDGTIASADSAAGAFVGVRYTHTLTLKNGLTNIVGARVRRSRTVVSGAINYNLSILSYGPESATTFTATSASGVSTAVCSDALWGNAVAGVAGTPGTERYQWALRIRKYDRKTFIDDIYTGRRYGQGGLLSGVTEEIQCAVVPSIVLSEAAAAALTGIAMAPSGATGGTSTITATRTLAEVWQYYRQWIALDANFTSDDTWLFDGVDLTTGGWTVAATFTLGGTYTFLTGAIANSLAVPLFTGGTANIGAAATYGFSTSGTIVSMTPVAASTYIFGGTHGGTLSLKNTSAFAISVQVPRGTVTTTAANIGGVITVVFANTGITVSGIIAGSRILYRRTDTQAVLRNAAVVGTTDTYSYQWTTDLPVEVIIRKGTAAPFYQPSRSLVTLGVNDSSLTVAQISDT